MCLWVSCFSLSHPRLCGSPCFSHNPRESPGASPSVCLTQASLGSGDQIPWGLSGVEEGLRVSWTPVPLFCVHRVLFSALTARELLSPPRVIHTAGSPIVQKTDRGGCASWHAHVQILPGGPWGSPETTRLGQKGPNPTWGEGVAWKEHVRHLRFLSKPGALGRVQAGEVPSSRRHSGLCGFCFLPRGNTCFRISHTL